jgi:hypothetical protein
MTDLLADAKAELYQGDPEDFMARRGELVAQAREAGQAGVAKQIGALRKPTRSAWVVNRLVRADPEVTARLAALAAELRGGGQVMDGARIRELTAARARLVDELTGQALDDFPAAPSALREEVTATFDAALADPEVAADLGTLVRAAHWAGFGLAPAPDGAPASPPHLRKPRNPRQLSPVPSANAVAARKSRRPNGPWLKPTAPRTPPTRLSSTWKTRSGGWKPSWRTPASSSRTPGGRPTGPSRSSGGRARHWPAPGVNLPGLSQRLLVHMRPPSCLEDLGRNGGSVDTLTGVEHLAEPDGFRDFVEARSNRRCCGQAGC